jgi:hypothetical protein
MRDQEIREALNQHWSASNSGDFATEHRIYHEDAILDYPQSRETQYFACPRSDRTTVKFSQSHSANAGSGVGAPERRIPAALAISVGFR